MDKNFIVNEIQRTAKQNGGKPLGQERFASETEVRQSDWLGKYWVRWSDALREAGFEPNKYISAYDSDFLLEKLALLTRELGHFPLIPELRMMARADKNFPSHTVFDRMGQKKERVLKLSEFCVRNKRFEDIIPYLALATTHKQFNLDTVGETQSKGYVYLVRHGLRNEYKIGRTNNPIRREGELTIELPEKLAPVH